MSLGFFESRLSMLTRHRVLTLQSVSALPTFNPCVYIENIQKLNFEKLLSGQAEKLNFKVASPGMTVFSVGKKLLLESCLRWEKVKITKLYTVRRNNINRYLQTYLSLGKEVTFSNCIRWNKSYLFKVV
jgi:hypothetical protein